MTTVEEIKMAVDLTFKSVSRRQIIRYTKAAGVKPISGRRSRPLVFPDDAVKKVIQYLQLPPETKIPTMAQLRDLRNRSQKARSR